MGPPNSVAIASPIPNSYFGNVFGAVAHFPSAYTWHGEVQPFIPTAHHDVDSTGRTLPLQAFNPDAPDRPATIFDRWLTNLRRNPPIKGGIESPLSYWKRQLPVFLGRGESDA